MIKGVHSRGFSVFGLILYVAAVAAGFGGLGVRDARAAEDQVKIRAIAKSPKVVQGGTMVVAVEMDFGAELHAWPAKSVPLPKDIDELAIRTEITPPKNADDKPVVPTWLASFDGVQFPSTKTGKVPDPSGGSKPVSAPVYAGKVVAYVQAHIMQDAPLGPQSFPLWVSYQACNDQVCFPPEQVSVDVGVTVVSGKEVDTGAPNEPALFNGFDATKIDPSSAVVGVVTKPAPTKPVNPSAATPSTNPATTPSSTPTPGTESGATSQGGSLFGLNLGNSIWLLFLAAALGGVILNLTPCVLPVIPIKVLTLTKHASSKSHALSLGLWMFAGVVAFWAVIGIPMAFINAAFDPAAIIFGTWWVTFAIGLLIVIFGLGIMGMFTINLPQSVYAVETEADSAFGSFFFGVFTALLGLPCFGFVAGSLTAAAAVLPAITIMAIFVGIGVGMGAPYLVLSVYPNLLKFVPRTGPASELVKQVMGILLLAAAAFFITAGIQALLKELPYLSGSMTWWAVGFFVAIAGIWMTIRTYQIARTIAAKVIVPIVAVAMTLGIGLFAQDRFTQDMQTYLAVKDATAQGQTPAGVWLPYTPELLAKVQLSGRPVFLDFTADWCLTCQALKARVLDKEPLKSEFKRRGVVLMEVDTTVRKGQGSKLLTQLGRTGVPAWAVFAPGSEKPKFVPVESPTSGTVLAELDALGVKSPTAGAVPSDSPSSVSR